MESHSRSSIKRQGSSHTKGKGKSKGKAKASKAKNKKGKGKSKSKSPRRNNGRRRQQQQHPSGNESQPVDGEDRPLTYRRSATAAIAKLVRSGVDVKALAKHVRGTVCVLRGVPRTQIVLTLPCCGVLRCVVLCCVVLCCVVLCCVRSRRLQPSHGAPDGKPSPRARRAPAAPWTAHGRTVPAIPPVAPAPVRRESPARLAAPRPDAVRAAHGTRDGPRVGPEEARLLAQLDPEVLRQLDTAFGFAAPAATDSSESGSDSDNGDDGGDGDDGGASEAGEEGGSAGTESDEANERHRLLPAATSDLFWEGAGSPPPVPAAPDQHVHADAAQQHQYKRRGLGTSGSDFKLDVRAVV